MNTKHLFAVVAATLALGSFAGVASAQTPDDASFSGMWKMDYIDKNKDGMVSKAEFVDMMAKVWDMKAKEMKIKADKMSAEEFKKFKASFGVV